MASIFRPFSVVCAVLFLANAVTSIPTREFDSMLDILRVRGYDLFCNAIVTSDLQFDLLSYQTKENTNATNSQTFTFFAPTDSSLFALDMTQTASSYIDTLRFHVVPRRLSIAQLRLLPDGYTLPTLLPERRLNVTHRPGSTVMAVGGVDIAFPGLFYGRNVAVHGLAGILSIRSNTAAGVASSSPSPAVAPIRSADHRSFCPSSSPNSSENQTVLAPSARPVVSPVPKFVSFNVTSRPGSPPPVENIPPVRRPVHAPSAGPTAVTRQAPAASPVDGRVHAPEPERTIHTPASEPAVFHSDCPAGAPLVLGNSPISSTESPAHSYFLAPEVSPAFTPISEKPRYPHSAISLPPVEHSEAAPVGLHVWVRKKDSVSPIETFTGDSKGRTKTENLGGEVAAVGDVMAEKSEALDDIRNCVTADVGLGLQHSMRQDHASMQCYAA